MAFDRRNFLQRLAATGAAVAAGSFFQTLEGQALQEQLQAARHRSLDDITPDEEFWHWVKQAYTVSPTILNLNNGGVSPQPRVVQEAVERYNRLSNEAPSYYMWRILDKGREPLRARLADLAGVSPEEIAIQRNSSEALETIIFGLRLQRGDEVVLAKQDYPNMINAWKQRAHRDGILLKWIDLDLPLEDEDFIVGKYVEAFSPRTRIVHITHIINWMGQILPAQRIAREAHQRGIEVVVDAAHSFAHLDFKIPDLECDYFGTSLHKWLCAPFGSGMLYVKKDKIKNLYPLLAAPDPEAGDIRKFEALGTRSFAIEQAIGQAIDFHELIGTKRKQQRLHYLKSWWTQRVKDLPGVHIGTSLDPRFSCAIALLQVEGKTPKEVHDYLFNKHKIHTVPINWENIHGVRITPNVYTTTKDLERLVAAIHQLQKNGSG